MNADRAAGLDTGLGFDSGIRTGGGAVEPGDGRDSRQGSTDPILKFAGDVDEIMAELSALMVRKQLDYGPKNISDSPGGALNGLLVRMNDKMQRLVNLWYHSDGDPQNESVEDTFMDLANYGVIGLMVLRGRWPA